MNKSEQMARVRSRDTGPEKLVRKLLSKSGVRYRLHRRDLPGTPDVYVPRLRLAIFINGCFWHGHTCVRARLPQTNGDFWRNKIARNMERDSCAKARLESEGIDVLVLWTCESKEFSPACIKIAKKYRAAS